jgi:hypothetical protein
MMEKVTLKLKDGVHESHASLYPLSEFPEELEMMKDGTYYWTIEPNNSHGDAGRFGENVGILHADIEKHYI